MVSESEERPGTDDRTAAARRSAHPTPVVKNWRFRPQQHLRSGTDFERVYNRKCRGSDHHLLVFGDWNGLPETRIGLSVSRKLGNAVIRNRLKRMLREAFRLSQYDIPAGLDLILIPKAGSQSTVDDYRQSLVRSARYVARKLKSAGVPGGDG